MDWLVAFGHSRDGKRGKKQIEYGLLTDKDGRPAFWMQTTGASLLAVNRCSPAHVRTLAQDSRSAHGLLYLAAVRDDEREQEHCQGRIDVGPASLTAPEAVCCQVS